jgi:hypothetical protein
MTSEFLEKIGIGNYDEKEKQQLLLIRQHYGNYINQALPKVFDMKDGNTRPKAPLTKADLIDDPFIRRCQEYHGPFLQKAIGLISIISAYQRLHYHRQVGYTPLYDPTQLALYELKEWLVTTLSKNDYSEDTLADVNKRIKYLNALINPDIFPQGEQHDVTMLGTLVNIRQELAIIADKIRYKLAQSTVLQFLDKLMNDSQNLLEGGVRYLYYILRADDDHQDFTWRSVLTLERFKSFLQSPTGRMIEFLLKQGVVNRILDSNSERTDGKELYQRNEDSISVSSSSGVKKEEQGKELVKVEDNQFLTMLKSSNSIPETMRTILQLKELPKSNDFTQFFQGEFYGEFFNDKEANGNYVKLHGLFLQLAHFYETCTIARFLAGEGGNLLLYGPGKEPFITFLQLYNSCVVEIKNVLEWFARKCHSINDDHIKSPRNKKPNFKIWQHNMGEKANGEKLIEHSIRCSETIVNIVTDARRMSFSERVAEVKRQATLFVDRVKGFANYQAFLLDQNQPFPSSSSNQVYLSNQSVLFTSALPASNLPALEAPNALTSGKIPVRVPITASSSSSSSSAPFSPVSFSTSTTASSYTNPKQEFGKKAEMIEIKPEINKSLSAQEEEDVIKSIVEECRMAKQKGKDVELRLPKDGVSQNGINKLFEKLGNENLHHQVKSTVFYDKSVTVSSSSNTAASSSSSKFFPVPQLMPQKDKSSSSSSSSSKDVTLDVTIIAPNKDNPIKKDQNENIKNILNRCKATNAPIHLCLVKYSFDEKAIAQLFQALRKENLHLRIVEIELQGANGNTLGIKGSEQVGEYLALPDNVLTRLEINGTKIDATQGVKALVDGLKANKNLTSLDLGFNKLGDKAVTEIADALMYHPAIETISLIGGNGIETGSIKSILMLLAMNHNIIRLDMSSFSDAQAGIPLTIEGLPTAQFKISILESLVLNNVAAGRPEEGQEYEQYLTAYKQSQAAQGNNAVRSPTVAF